MGTSYWIAGFVMATIMLTTIPVLAHGDSRGPGRESRMDRADNRGQGSLNSGPGSDRSGRSDGIDVRQDQQDRRDD